MKTKKTYAVIGLGKFGQYIAKGLIRSGEHVIVADNAERNVKEFKDITDEVYVLDSTDKDALLEAGIKDLDIVIVSIGEDIESSILTVIALQELSNKYIIAKAVSRSHGIILNKLGVDLVVRPEQDASLRLLDKLLWNETNMFVVNNNLNLCKLPIKEADVGKSKAKLEKELNNATSQQKKQKKIISVYQNGSWNLADDITLELGAILLLLEKQDPK
ncbi:MAG: TrkA family potassium uptake protein [Helicobacteraceae bacterium]|nr:TrkA family potassium uptake protein [Helicobacteraceae bacterium]